MNFLKFLLSFLFPVKVTKTSSRFNPVLEVCIENGKYVMNSQNANYSFGSLHRIFLKAFERLKIKDRKIKNVLCLGLGAGSIPDLLKKKFQPGCRITAVEIDEKVIELAKKYFNIQQFHDLDIICDDAFNFVKKCNSRFDLIIMDIFIDNVVPPQFETEDFLASVKKIMSRESLFIFNTMPAPASHKNFAALQNNFTEIFGVTIVLHVMGNVVLAAENN